MNGFHLFQIPSFRAGVARALDLFGLYDSYNESATPEEADARALESDWAALGRDCRVALSTFTDELRAEKHPRQLDLFKSVAELPE